MLVPKKVPSVSGITAGEGLPRATGPVTPILQRDNISLATLGPDAGLRVVLDLEFLPIAAGVSGTAPIAAPPKTNALPFLPASKNYNLPDNRNVPRGFRPASRSIIPPPKKHIPGQAPPYFADAATHPELYQFRAVSPRRVERAAPGSVQENIAQQAHALIGSTNFRGVEVTRAGRPGDVACAQVVSAALRNAGVMEREELSVVGLQSSLTRKGWQDVKSPVMAGQAELKEGDVISWNTKGRDAEVTSSRHIGIIVRDARGNLVAVNNSSRSGMPKYANPFTESWRITRVQRMS